MSLFNTCMNILLIGLTSIITLGMLFVIVVMMTKIFDIVKDIFKSH